MNGLLLFILISSIILLVPVARHEGSTKTISDGDMMSNQTSVEEQLKNEIHRLNGLLYGMQKEVDQLRKKTGHQKRIMSRQRATIDKLRLKINFRSDKQQYVNVQKGKASGRRAK